MDELNSSDLAFAHLKPLQTFPIHDSRISSSTTVFECDRLNEINDRSSRYSLSNHSLGFITLDNHRLNDYNNQSVCCVTPQSSGAARVEHPYHVSLSRSTEPPMIKSEDPFLHSGIIPDCSPGSGESFIFHGYPAAAENFTAMLNDGESSSGAMVGLPNIQTMIHHPREVEEVGCGGSFLVPQSPIMTSYGTLVNQSQYIMTSPSAYIHNFSNVSQINVSDKTIKHEQSPANTVSKSTDNNELIICSTKTPKTDPPPECRRDEVVSKRRCGEGKSQKDVAKNIYQTRIRTSKTDVKSCFSNDNAKQSSNFKMNENSSLNMKSGSKIPVLKFNSKGSNKEDTHKVQYKQLSSSPANDKDNQVFLSEENNCLKRNDVSSANGDEAVNKTDSEQFLAVECDNIPSDGNKEEEEMENSINAEKLEGADSGASNWPEVDFSGSIADPVVESSDILNTRMFTDKLDVNVHIEECQCVMVDGTKRWRCLQCPKMYSTKHNLIIHILGHSGIKPHCCGICNKYFKQVSHLQTHMLTHGNVKPHICHVCNRTFTQASHVKRHMSVHMERRPHTCKLCNRSFAHSSEIKAHAERHKCDCDRVCDECGATFDGIDRLYKHKAADHHNMMDVKDSGSLTCKVCAKSFMYPSQLRDHAAKHDGSRPFICGECGMDFMKEHHLKSHMFTHTGLRPYQCKECGKAFNQKANLQRHLLVHNGEKRFACEVCGRGFTQHQILRAHLVTHQETKPFQCKVCGKGFSRLHNLNGHMLMHEGGKPFTCSCGASFTLKGNLNQHKRDKHGQVVKDDDDEGGGVKDDDHSHTSDHIQVTKMLNDSASIQSAEDDSGNLDDRSPATPKKKRKSMPRKTALEATEGDEVDEVKAAWRLTSEDSLMEEGVSGEEEEGEDEGEELMRGGVDEEMIGGETVRLVKMSSSSSSSLIEDEERDSDVKLLCTLQPVDYNSICTK